MWVELLGQSRPHRQCTLPEFRVVEETWRPFEGEKASLEHVLVHLFVPHRARFRVSVKGLPKNDNWVTILGASIGIEPGFRPKAFWQSKPGARPAWFINVRLNVGFARVSGGSSATLESAYGHGRLRCCKAGWRSTYFLV